MRSCGAAGNQPHAIFLSELEYRAASSDQERRQVTERYADVVSSSADFMADFARGGRAGNESSGYRYELGPPIMNSAEHGDKLALPLGCGAAGNPCLGYVFNPTCALLSPPGWSASAPADATRCLQTS